MINDLKTKKELDKYIVYTIIKENEKNINISKEEIISILEERDYDIEKIESFLNDLLHQNKIILENGGYRVAFPTLMQELEKLKKDEKKYDMVMKKLSGYTLEQIGIEYSVSKERVRQIISKEMKKIQHVEEEKFLEYMVEYDFKEELFCKLFRQEKYVYYYLKEKYKKGQKDPSELLDDERLTSEQIGILQKEYNVIRYNDENIVADTMSIILAYLKK